MDQPIAVIGLDARLPGDGADAEKFYQSLLAGRSARSPYPEDRYNAAAFWHPDGERHGMATHFLQGSVKTFDAPFFTTTAAEANAMDPQQRGLLESVYRALDSAGIPLDKAAGTQTGVYMGCFAYDYHDISNKDLDMPSKYGALGPTAYMLANRVSWFYDFRGPSMTIDTACSSSLVAAHEACMSLKLGEISMAVVGGCNLILSPEMTLNLDAAGVLGPDGKSYSFDYRGNGYARGEGLGTIILKRVPDAVRDGDVIRAVIRNSSTNQDGRSQGITQPTAEAQARLIRHVYDRANLDLSQTRFFEAHGTGTFIGDPIEASAIADVFGPYRSAEQPLYVGALKTNIGHLEGAAGVASIIKGVMTLEHGTIPPNIHMEKRNPRIQTDILEFPTMPLPWPSPGLRRMSINSFGVGGSNVHIVLDDALSFLAENGLDGHHRTHERPVGISHVTWNHKRDTELSCGRVATTAITKETSSNGTTSNQPSEKERHQTHVLDLTANCEKGNSSMNGYDTHENISGSMQGILVADKRNGTYSLDHSNNDTLIMQPDNDELRAEILTDVVEENQPNLYVFSSFDQAGISRVRVRLLEYLSRLHPSYDIELTSKSFMTDLAYTLATKRTHHHWRSFCVAGSRKGLIEQLNANHKAARSQVGQKLRLVFVFTGQGAQWAGMGIELLAHPVFYDSLTAAERYWTGLGCSWSAIDELKKSKETSNINDASYSQPLCTAIQVAMVDLLASWDIVPEAVVGHSAGETAAAYAVGAITRESAWRIAYMRGKSSRELLIAKSQESSHGGGMGMAAVGLDVSATRLAIERVNLLCGSQKRGTLEIACKNSPSSQTVSGCSFKIKQLVDMLASEGTFVRQLPVKLAYHSRYMFPMASKYLQSLGQLEPQLGDPGLNTARSADTQRLFYSSSHGTVLHDHSQLCKGAYWVHNLTHPVLFSESAAMLLADSRKDETTAVLLEIGPHGALKGPLKDIIKASGLGGEFTYATMLNRTKGATESVLEAMGVLHCAGVGMDLCKVTANSQKLVQVSPPRFLTSAPTYAFNHTKEYWMESRISRNYRFRRQARSELLGAQVPDWNKNHALWRNYIRISENPWIPHHIVSGEVLYPAAGMIVMAVEAVRQLTASDKREPEGFYLRDIVFEKALIVPDDALGVESHFYLTPDAQAGRHSGTSEASCWYRFELFTHDIASDEWQRHCHGRIRVDYEQHQRQLGDFIPVTKDHCIRETSAGRAYKALEQSGLRFGPTFRRLRKAEVSVSSGAGDNSYTYAEVETCAQKVAEMMPNEYLSPHIIHPTTLDAIIHSSLLAPALNEQSLPRTRMPISVDLLWLSAKMENIHSPCRVASECSPYDDGRKLNTSIVAVGDPTEKASQPLMYAFGLNYVVLPGPQQANTSKGHTAEKHPKPAYHKTWRPSTGFLSQSQCQERFGLPLQEAEADKVSNQVQKNELLCQLYIQQYLEKTSIERIKMPVAQREYSSQSAAKADTAERYTAWMRNAIKHKVPVVIGEKKQKELEKCAQETPEGRLLLSVGQVLPSILAGTSDALAIIFEGDLARDFYGRNPSSLRCYRQLCNYIEALVDENPSLKMLEIGAGTGGTTTYILDMLSKRCIDLGSDRYDRYDFTDISTFFFDRAKDDFAEHADWMHFLKLDIEADPVKQGFEAHSYDCIIAANVLHATKNIERTLANVRRLLKPGGKLILYEMTNPAMLAPGFIWGTLPGWWLAAEEDRIFSPLMTRETWEARLRNAGFPSGIDIVFRDFEGSASQSYNVLIATAPSDLHPPTSQLNVFPSVTLLTENEASFQQEVASQILEGLMSAGHSGVVIASTASSNDIELPKTKTAFILIDLDKPVLQQVTAESLSKIQRIPMEYCTVIWIARGGSEFCASPESELVTGLGRVCRLEYPNLQFIIASFDAAATSQMIAEKSIQIHQRAIQGCAESFYRVLADGSVHVPRLQPAKGLTEHIRALTGGAEPELKRIEDCSDQYLTLRFGHINDSTEREAPCFTVDCSTKDNGVLVADDVEIRVMAASVSTSDLRSLKNSQITDHSVGRQASGIVVRCGPESHYHPGDRVFGLVPTGSVRTVARSSDRLLAKMPFQASWADVVSLSAPFTTAVATVGDEIDSIQRKNLSVLVTNAASMVGQAVVTIAQAKGAQIYATVNSRMEKERLIELFHLASDHVLLSCRLMAALTILPSTFGRGVDIIANCSGANNEEDELISCLACCGKVFDLGTTEDCLRPRRRPNIRFESFRLESHLAHDSRAICGKFQRAADFIISHNLHSGIWITQVPRYPFSEIQTGLRQLAMLRSDDLSAGTITLECGKEDLISVLELPQLCAFDSDATYVVCGGLGGLGGTIARWMVSRGARNLILLSRRGPQDSGSRALINDIMSTGCSIVAPVCDATNLSALESTIAKCHATMPGIKGCINAAMVLRDHTFMSMNEDHWNEVVLSKVGVLENLFKVLGANLDFYITLSSVIGLLGKTGQSNYASGNTFQDAFTSMLASRGVNAISLNLCPMLGVGFLSERPELLAQMHEDGWPVMDKSEFLAVMDYYCRPLASSEPSAICSHVIPKLCIPTTHKANDAFFSLIYAASASEAATRALVEASKSGKKASFDYFSLIKASITHQEVYRAVSDALLLKVCRMLDAEMADIDLARPLHAYGIDSLMVVELRSWLFNKFTINMSVFEMAGFGSIHLLVSSISSKCRPDLQDHASHAQASAEDV
ncbi:hypothetical protein NLG97_g34 [Lecanicillium saksenae]|uniref:Uncharacterized protein n=1 Tax=Lecanicillium saksenae TaxID=468837 RepID=A0ACC1R9Q2_9HYPO|nr:hypothetical protein NLG97_g34 [Lecanicillium saksenae]